MARQLSPRHDPADAEAAGSDRAPNVWRGIEPRALSRMLHGSQAPLVLDLRPPELFSGEGGHIEGASLFPADQLEVQLLELSGLEARAFVLVCQDGLRCNEAVASMTKAGFSNVRTLLGGMNAWTTLGLPLTH